MATLPPVHRQIPSTSANDTSESHEQGDEASDTVSRASVMLVDQSSKESTKKNYRSHLHQFGCWLMEQEDPYPGIVTSYNTTLKNGTTVRKFSIDAAKLVDCQLEPFFKFVHEQQERKKPDGTPSPVSAGTLRGYRSAVSHAIASDGLVLSESLKHRVHLVFKGVGNRDSELRQAGYGRIDIGKDPLPVEVYRYLMKFCQSSDEPTFRFVAAFLSLQWNTCSRSVNTATIHLSHMSWKGDSLLTHFSRSKMDQQGSKPKNKSHIFANPTDPATCPILNLGLYLLEFVDSSGYLFPGSNQESRYSGALRKLFAVPEVSAILRSGGFGVDRLGTHSIRKGAASFACNGSPQGVGIVAMCLRAAWKIGSVLERYLHHQEAGDCVAGRTLACLPSDSELFGLLPPHPPQDSSVIWSAVKSTFCASLVETTNMRPILVICMSQIVYHHEYLENHLSRRHPLRRLPWFCDKNLLGNMRAQLITGSSSPVMRASGVPIWVELLLRMKQMDLHMEELRDSHVKLTDEFHKLGDDLRDRLSDHQQAVNQQLDSFGSAMREGRENLEATVTSNVAPRLQQIIQDIYEERAEQSGQLTRRAVFSVVQEAMREMGIVGLEDHGGPQGMLAALQESEDKVRLLEIKLNEAVEQLQQREVPNQSPPTGPQARTVESASSEEQADTRTLVRLVSPDGFTRWFFEDGIFRRTPPGFEHPRQVLVQEGWQLWICGDSVRKIGPYRGLSALDLPSGRLQRVQSEWRKIFNASERFLKLKGSFKENPTHEEARQMFAQLRPFLLKLRLQPDSLARPICVSTLARKMRCLKDAEVQDMFQQLEHNGDMNE